MSRAQPPSTARSAAFQLPSPDLQEPAALLRGWVHGRIRSVLSEAADPDTRRNLVEDSRKLLALAPYLPAAELPDEARSRLRSYSLQPIRLQKKPVPLDDPVALALAQGMEHSRLRRLVKRLPEAPSVWFPPVLWFVLTRLSWSLPAWQHEVTREIGEALRRQVLLPDGHLEAACFRLETFWFLIELVAVSVLDPAGLWTRPLALRAWRREIRPLEPARARWMGGALQRLAKEQLDAAGWAGFWDQWLIAETALTHPWCARRGSPRVRRLLSALPWLAQPRYDTLREEDLVDAPPKDELAEHVDPDWEKQTPAALADLGSTRKNVDLGWEV